MRQVHQTLYSQTGSACLEYLVRVGWRCCHCYSCVAAGSLSACSHSLNLSRPARFRHQQVAGPCCHQDRLTQAGSMAAHHHALRRAQVCCPASANHVYPHCVAGERRVNMGYGFSTVEGGLVKNR
jgi:hypothetical protein